MSQVLESFTEYGSEAVRFCSHSQNFCILYS